MTIRKRGRARVLRFTCECGARFEDRIEWNTHVRELKPRRVGLDYAGHRAALAQWRRDHALKPKVKIL